MAEIELTDGDLLRLANSNETLREVTGQLDEASKYLAAVANSVGITRVALEETITAKLEAAAPKLEDDTPPDIVDGVDQNAEPESDVDEGDPFEKGGAYDWLKDMYVLPPEAPQWVRDLCGKGLIQVTDPTLADNGPAEFIPRANWNSDQLFELPPEASGNRVRCTSAQYPNGDAGPKWWMRNFEVTGERRDNYVWRVGDFRKGREGHFAYLNVRRDLLIENELAVQNGAQVYQLVWRTNETKSDPSEWPDAWGGSIVLRNTGAIDPGVINQGSAVRASWPYSIFNTGHSLIEIDGVFLRCNHAKPFRHNTRGECRSHGFLHVMPAVRNGEEKPGRRYVRHDMVRLRNLNVEIHDPDREMCRFGAIREVRIESGRMVAHTSEGHWDGNAIAVHHDVDTFYMAPEVEFDGRIIVYGPEDDWRDPVAVISRKTGEELAVRPAELM